MNRQLRLRRDEVAWSDLGGEIVILDMRSSTYFAVRNTAASLVTELIEGATEPALVNRLVALYPVSPDVAGADVRDFLAELTSRDLLEPADA